MKKGNAWALLPIGVFLAVYLGLGLTFEYIMKIEMGFYQTPAIVAFLIALAVACFQNRKLDFNAKLKVMANGVADENILATGEFMDVEGTPFDFRAGQVIGEGLKVEKENEQLVNGAGYDHNWILDRKSENEIEFAASVWEPTSGRYMEVWTDQPALQFYGGNFFDGSTEGKWGRTLNYRESYALETQLYPDSPNHAHFPSTRLNPGEEYTHTCIYKFATK